MSPGPHPVWIILGCFALAGLERRGFLPRLGPPLPEEIAPVGMALMVAGAVALVLGYAAMLRAGTTIDRRHASRQLVSTGIFRMSRNPIYLGWFLVFLGAGLENGRSFEVAMAGVMWGLLHWLVVPSEERYLEREFGESYTRYRARVRRWL